MEEDQQRLLYGAPPSYAETMKNSRSTAGTGGHTIVIHQPIRKDRQTVHLQPPDDFTVPAWLACLCCFWPLGCCAVTYAYKAKELWMAGRLSEAKQASQCAKRLAISSVLIGILCIVIAILVLTTQ